MSRLDDGYQTLIEFDLAPSVKFYEKEVTPPGLDGGAPVETTTMRNTELATFNPQALITMSPMTLVVAYDPEVYTDIRIMINVNQLITVTFPDDSTLQFWGYVQRFTPGQHTRGTQPTAEVVIQPTNQNSSGAETDYVYTAA